jgi:two-component system response regulator
MRSKPKPMEECDVLYVEDDDATAYLFQRALEQAHVYPRLFRVTDGDQATTFLSRTGAYESAPRPDLVLLDLSLPRKSGFDVLAEIRQIPELADLPVVVFSTSIHSHDRERAMVLGADRYFSKQNEFDSFVQVAESVCQMLRG